ncbi:MAG: hypothetical protein QM633_03955, partial [Propionicimonas sp.]
MRTAATTHPPRPDPANRAGRTRRWAGAALTVLLALTSGCAAMPAASGAAATADRTVTDAEGTPVTVPANPSRVVVLS